jgi:hypothetical protein
MSREAPWRFVARRTVVGAFERTTHRGSTVLFYPQQLVAAWRTPPFPCNAHLTPFCGLRYSPYVKGLSSLFVFFNFIYYLAPPRQVGGSDPRGALERRPSAEPRRWRPAGGAVAGAQLGILLCDNLRVI